MCACVHVSLFAHGYAHACRVGVLVLVTQDGELPCWVLPTKPSPSVSPARCTQALGGLDMHHPGPERTCVYSLHVALHTLLWCAVRAVIIDSPLLLTLVCRHLGDIITREYEKWGHGEGEAAGKKDDKKDA